MLKAFALLPLLLLVGLVCAQTRQDYGYIDSFEEGQNALYITLTSQLNTTDPPVVKTDFAQSPSGASSTSLIGGERDLQMQVTSGYSQNVYSTTVIKGQGEWDISTPSGGSSVNTIQWDGIDGSWNLNTKGLGGRDFTFNGKANGFRTNSTTDLDTQYTLNVYDMNGGNCQVTQTMKGAQLSGQYTQYTVLFTAFSGSCDWTNVGAITMEVPGLDNVDTVTSVLAISGDVPSNSPTASPTRNAPSPSPSNTPLTASETRSNTPTPAVASSPSRTPSASVYPTCKCSCPKFRCGLIFDRPMDDDGHGHGHSEHVIYRPVFYYAENHDFDGIYGDDGRESYAGRVAYFNYIQDEVPLYVYESGASVYTVSIALIAIAIAAVFL